MLAQLEQQSAVKRWVVAYSGGLDSTVLLHLLIELNATLVRPVPICALHINHHLSDNADYWQRQCEQQALAWGVDYIAQSVAVIEHGQGVEAAARSARYQCFESCLQQGDCLLMAHHSDDQAETLLLRLFRGAGVLGLSAMPAQRSLGPARLLRPLLTSTRSELEHYAQRHKLCWVEDESNHSVVFDRNYVRHHVIPLIQQRWPQLVRQCTQAASNLREANSLLSELAALDLHAAAERSERLGFSLDWHYLRSLTASRRHNCFRYCCAQKGFSLPGAGHLQQIEQQFFGANTLLTSACVEWGDNAKATAVQFRQFNQRLYLMPSLMAFVKPVEPVDWHGRETMALGLAGRLSLVEGLAQNLSQNLSQNLAEHPSTPMLAKRWVDGKQVRIAWRLGGERCRPVGRAASQTVKKLLQEYHLETWLRDRVPLIYIDNDLAAVGDLWVCEPFAAQQDELAYRIVWDID
ncbi:MAG: tRNA lysidine(34) synthetase TilS [Pseudomonadota bacterium]